jgi:hypothetical protein
MLNITLLVMLTMTLIEECFNHLRQLQLHLSTIEHLKELVIHSTIVALGRKT